MKKNQSVTGKIIFMGLIVGVLLLVNLWTGSKVHEREKTRNNARFEIENSAGGSFIVSDIKVFVPYERNVVKYNSKGEAYTAKEYGTKEISFDEINCQADITTEIRSLGIYKAPIYTGNVKVNGQFDFPFKNNGEYTYSLSRAKCIVCLTDKSVVENPLFVMNGSSRPVEFAATEKYVNGNGFDHIRQTELSSVFVCKQGNNSFSAELKVRGAKSFGMCVIGKQTVFSVKSDWASPSFANFDYLPTVNNVTKDGFTADWFVPWGGDQSNKIGFKLVTPVDVYRMLERAVTYGFLFIIVPFIVLFLFEVFMKLSLHPMNYLLCGTASIVFFLLLMSFSEHIPFVIAYMGASLASGIVISLYVASITKKIKAGFGMCGVFIVMYGYLFISLKSEDYALVMGSVFVFLVIAALMFFTRKVDWNNLQGIATEKNLIRDDKTE